MELISKILDLPVIIQGALGSFLFWLAYTLLQKITSLTVLWFGKYNTNLKKENLLFEQSHLLQEIDGSDSNAHQLIHILSIQAAFYKFTQGVIFVCLGLIADKLLGWLSILAYLIAIYFFFRALKASYITLFNDGISIEEKQIKLKQLNAELKRIKEIEKN